jgi:hypothetical protein
LFRAGAPTRASGSPRRGVTDAGLSEPEGRIRFGSKRRRASDRRRRGK